MPSNERESNDQRKERAKKIAGLKVDLEKGNRYNGKRLAIVKWNTMAAYTVQDILCECHNCRKLLDGVTDEYKEAIMDAFGSLDEDRLVRFMVENKLMKKDTGKRFLSENKAVSEEAEYEGIVVTGVNDGGDNPMTA